MSEISFDLARELAEDPKRRSQLIQRIGSIQSELGAKIVDNPSPLLQELLGGYTALQRVIGKIK